MCGIFLAVSKNTKTISKIYSQRDKIIKTIRRRGPDYLSIKKDSNFVAIHSLLSITGLRLQPIITDKLLILFNGEIYNDYKNYNHAYNDTDLIVKTINSRDNVAFTFFDGEFAICAYLFKRNRLLLATDPFATKPLYFQSGADFLIAGTFDTTVAKAGQRGEIKKVPANTLIEIDTKNFQIKSQKIIRPFDFSNQNSTDFEKWNHVFKKAIIKRTYNSRHRVFLGLSSGHDSGLMVAEMIEQKIPFHAYVMTYLEDQKIIDERIKILKKNQIKFDVLDPSKKEWRKIKNFVSKNVEPYKLINPDDSFQNFSDPDLRKNSGFIASALIFKHAKENGEFIGLSGQGGDEIYSDYYNEFANPKMSELKGKWHGVKGPWRNFYGGWNKVFLGGNERISSLFGIESRYPFLDFNVVQEFINLLPKLKSNYYKAPITNRLNELNFPFHPKKFGFAGFNDKSLVP